MSCSMTQRCDACEAQTRYHSTTEPLRSLCLVLELLLKVSKGAKIRNRYNQVSHLSQDTNGKVTNSQLDTTDESQEVSPFPVLLCPSSFAIILAGKKELVAILLSSS